MACNREPKLEQDGASDSAVSVGVRPLVSVVIPVYDVEPYIGEAVRSICEQTYDAWELICVDDGSHDGSLRICEELAEVDERIRVVTQAHQGLGAARNHGLALAQGTYLYFLDGDDLVDPLTLEKCVNAAEEHRTDMVQFGGKILVEDGKWHDEQRYARSHLWPGVWDGPRMYVAQRQMGDYVMQANTYLCRRELFSGVAEAYPVDVIHEDEYGTFRIMMSARRVVCLDEQLYCHRFRVGSIMTSRDWGGSARGYFRSYAMVLAMPDTRGGGDDDAYEKARRLCLENLALLTIACYFRCGRSLRSFPEVVRARPGDEEALSNLLARKALSPRGFWANRAIERARWRLGVAKRWVSGLTRSSAIERTPRVE